MYDYGSSLVEVYYLALQYSPSEAKSFDLVETREGFEARYRQDRHGRYQL